MRDVKFRIWYYHQAVFKYGGLDLFSKLSFPLNWCCIQQYTGLQDKNGKDIYEGDLIQYNRQSSYDGTNFEAKWSEDRWGWALVSKNGDFLGNEYTPEGDRYKFIEIVGNIFEKSIDSKQ